MIEALIKWVPLILPEVVLVAAACVLFLGATVRTSRNLWGSVALAVLAAAGVVAWWGPRPTT